MDKDTRDGVVFGLSMTAVVLIAVGACVAVGLLIWGISGWTSVQNTKRQVTVNDIQAHGYRHGYDYQQTQRAAITSDIRDVVTITTEMYGVSGAQLQALGAQRWADVEQLCQDAITVTGDPLPSDQAAFVAQNCEAGVGNPSSKYAPH